MVLETRARQEGHHPLDAEPPPVQPWTAAMEITENRPQIIPADGSAIGGIAQRPRLRDATTLESPRPCRNPSSPRLPSAGRRSYARRYRPGHPHVLPNRLTPRRMVTDQDDDAVAPLPSAAIRSSARGRP